MSLAAENVSVSHGGQRRVAEVTLSLYGGELLVLVGPNAAGKSSLLDTMAGTLRPTAGRVTLDGVALSRWDGQALARRRAVLPQQDSLTFPFRVEEVVELAFTPYRSVSGVPSRIADSLERMGAGHLIGRRYTELSGGERRRVQLARVLAQVQPMLDGDGAFLLLDEPTAALDLAQQHAVMAALRGLAHAGVGVLAVVHDLSLAARYADRLALMQQGRLRAVGHRDAVLQGPLLGEVFGVGVSVERAASGEPVIAVLP